MFPSILQKIDKLKGVVNKWSSIKHKVRKFRKPETKVCRKSLEIVNEEISSQNQNSFVESSINIHKFHHILHHCTNFYSLVVLYLIVVLFQ